MLLGAACTFGAEDTGEAGHAAPDEPATRVWSLQSPS
jgi:hypothetical protein